MRFRWSLVALLFVAVAGLASAQMSDEEAIRATIEEFAAAMVAGDVAGCMAMWADDAIDMPPNAPAVVGKAAIEAATQAEFEMVSYTDFQVPIEEIEIPGDWAFVRGTYSITVTPNEGGDPTEDNGKYIVIVERQADGSWKTSRAIYNSDNPPSGM